MPSEAFEIMIDLGSKLADLVREHAEWSQKTFGDDKVRGPVGPLKHLQKEARETILAWSEVDLFIDKESLVFLNFKEELADCFLLLLDASRRGGVKVMQLIEAAQAKLEINKQREWPKVDPNEAVEHIRGE